MPEDAIPGSLPRLGTVPRTGRDTVFKLVTMGALPAGPLSHPLQVALEAAEVDVGVVVEQRAMALQVVQPRECHMPCSVAQLCPRTIQPLTLISTTNEAR